jgi:hypothetical protein
MDILVPFYALLNSIMDISFCLSKAKKDLCEKFALSGSKLLKSQRLQSNLLRE